MVSIHQPFLENTPPLMLDGVLNTPLVINDH